MSDLQLLLSNRLSATPDQDWSGDFVTPLTQTESEKLFAALAEMLILPVDFVDKIKRIKHYTIKFCLIRVIAYSDEK